MWLRAKLKNEKNMNDKKNKLSALIEYAKECTRTRQACLDDRYDAFEENEKEAWKNVEKFKQANNL